MTLSNQYYRSVNYVLSRTSRLLNKSPRLQFEESFMAGDEMKFAACEPHCPGKF